MHGRDIIELRKALEDLKVYTVQRLAEIEDGFNERLKKLELGQAGLAKQIVAAGNDGGDGTTEKKPTGRGKGKNAATDASESDSK